MGYSAVSLTCLLLHCCLFYLSLVPSAFSVPSFSSSFASTEIKFWSENVLNKMPKSISTKLSPLTKPDYYYYSEMISHNDFIADTNFCSLAKLFCSNGKGEVKHTDPTVDSLFCYLAICVGASPLSLDHVDPSSFFRLSILKQGNLIRLPNIKGSPPHRAFLPPEIMKKVSLSRNGIKKMFPHFPEETINKTLSHCNAPAMKGEIKTCSNSLEEMVSFSKNALGKKNKLIALATKSTSGSGSELLIKNVKKIGVEKFVVCHEIFLPFASYFCHSTSNSQIYSVDLVEPKTGAPVNTVIAVCHMDTSEWSAHHVAFQMLKFSPGQGEACHMLTEINLAWIAGGENM